MRSTWCVNICSIIFRRVLPFVTKYFLSLGKVLRYSSMAPSLGWSVPSPQPWRVISSVLVKKGSQDLTVSKERSFVLKPTASLPHLLELKVHLVVGSQT